VAYESFLLDDAEIAIFAYGVTARSARAAIRMARKEGIRVGLFRPISVWPFPDLELEKLAGQVKAIVVAEMNLGQLIYEVDRVVHGQTRQTRIVAYQKASGEPIHPNEILAAVRESR
jgi:2-oxoglutarate ferredoxin oxidoreductase subunit alpha